MREDASVAALVRPALAVDGASSWRQQAGAIAGSAALLGRPESTVRNGLRRVRRAADELCRRLLARATSWGWSGWELPPSELRRLWAAVQALAEQWRRRRGPASSWLVTDLITGGRLLATNRSTPLEAKVSLGSMARKANL